MLWMLTACLINTDLYDERQTALADADGDGWSIEAGDCDDHDEGVFPGADELCNDVDDDCDSEVDEDAVDVALWFVDADGDGAGSSSSTIEACKAPEGAVEAGGDCNDLDALVGPEAAEVCNDGIDNDCDGSDNGCSLSGALTTDDADGFILGAASGDGVGISLTTTDLNGDGQGDVLVGALHGNAAYVVSGRSMPSVSYLAATEGALTRAPDLPASYLLAQAIGGCDVDGDGWDDALVSGLDYGSASELWFFDGPITDDRTTDDAAGVFQAQGTTDFLGSAIACGDVNGDTLTDLIVSAGLHDGAAGTQTGAVYTLYGGSATTGRLEIADVAVELEGDQAGMHFGAYLAIADIDGDGLSDRIIGATEDGTLADDAGGVFVLTEATEPGSLEDAGVAIYSSEAASRFGVVAAGDLDDDGRSEIVVGADFSDGSAEDSGQAWVFTGAPAWESSLDANADYATRLLGTNSGDRLGIAVAVLDDMDQDGARELAVAASFADLHTLDGGGLYIFDHVEVEGGTLELSSAQLTIAGTNLGANAGYTIAGSADLDGDSFLDLVLGAYGDDTSGPNSGGTFVFHGQGL